MKKVSTCGERLGAAKLIVQGAKTISEISKETGCSESSIGTWVRKYRKHGEDDAIFGWGDPKFTDFKRIHLRDYPNAVTPDLTDLEEDISLSEILNQLGNDVNRLQLTVFELQTRFEQAFKMIK